MNEMLGGGSREGRLRRGVSTVTTRKSLRWGIGSGMRIASRWQFGGLESGGVHEFEKGMSGESIRMMGGCDGRGGAGGVG